MKVEWGLMLGCYTMACTFADQYRRWFEYEKDSHSKTLASLLAVPASRRSEPAFQKAVDLMAHIIAARRLWLFRFGATAESPRELFPRNAMLEELPQILSDTERAWISHLARMSDTDLARQFEYQSLEGGWYRNTVQDILAQLFGHSWYHRGQIAALVRSLGCEPAVTDFVFWTREPIRADDRPAR